MATTPILGLTKLEVGQASKEATINANLDILDNSTSGNASGAIWARVFHNTAQSLTNNTFTALAFNSERYDTNVIHDTSTNNTRLTCKTAGVYFINGTAAYAANATGIRELAVRIGGSTYIADVLSASASATEPTVLTISTTYLLAVNDYVELVGRQTSGAGLNVSNAANFTPEFNMVRLGA